MKRQLLILFTLPTMCFGFDDIFDEIPNFFDGVNFSAGIMQYHLLDSSNISDTESTDITDIFFPPHFLGTIHICSQSSNSISLLGRYLAIGGGLSSQETTAHNHKFTIDAPYFIELGVRTGLMANPSSLLYTEIGIGREHTKIGIKTQLLNVSVSGSYFYGSLSAGIELGVFEEWGTQIAVSARFNHDSEQSNNRFTVPDMHFGTTASLRLTYHPISTVTEPDDNFTQDLEVPEEHDQHHVIVDLDATESDRNIETNDQNDSEVLHVD